MLANKCISTPERLFTLIKWDSSEKYEMAQHLQRNKHGIPHQKNGGQKPHDHLTSVGKQSIQFNILHDKN